MHTYLTNEQARNASKLQCASVRYEKKNSQEHKFFCSAHILNERASHIKKISSEVTVKNFCRVSSVHTHSTREHGTHDSKLWCASVRCNFFEVNSGVILYIRFGSELTFQNFYPDSRLGCGSFRYTFSKVTSRVILLKKFSSEVIVENFYRIRTHLQRESKSRTPRRYDMVHLSKVQFLRCQV